MQVIQAGSKFADPNLDGMKLLRIIEMAGRICYQSEPKDDSDEGVQKFVRGLIKRHHEAVLEHAVVSVIFTCDRGVSHELVRHRIAAYCQESSRYCSYKGQLKVIDLATGFKYDLNDPIDQKKYAVWTRHCQMSEQDYNEMIDLGAQPQEARSVLPTSTKTQVFATFNLREWRHVFNLRALGLTGPPHPQMLEVMVDLLEAFKIKIPVVFDDLHVQI